MPSQQQEKQQQLLWHQRYIRDVGASLSTSLQQKENLKDSSLQQSSSTEASLEQPQGMQRKKRHVGKKARNNSFLG